MTNRHMTRFEVFIGTWNTTGEVYGVGGEAATSLIATDTYAWIPGKHFILHEADARFGDQVARSIEIMGYDAKRKKHFSRSYDDQGASEEFVLELRGRRWAITGAGMRFNGSFDANRNRLTGLWELKSAKGRWQPWIELVLERA